MSKPCKPAYKAKWNSANRALVICGKKCWTSIKATEEARAKAPRPPSALSCVRLVKPSPKSALAAPANVDHQAQLVSPAGMLTMDNQAVMAKREAQAKMPAGTKNCCRSHLNANAQRNPAQLAPLAHAALTDHQAMLAAQAEMVNQDPKDHPALLAHPAPTATLALLAHLVLLVL